MRCDDILFSSLLPLKCRHQSTKLHSVTSQNTATVTAGWSWKLTYNALFDICTVRFD